MLISFIIPTFKNVKSLKKCVEEIIGIVVILGLKYEIIVVDNCLSNDYVNQISSFIKLNVSIIKNPVIGAHHSRRLGLYNSKGDLLIFVDDDNYLTIDYIQYIILISESLKNKNFIIGCATKEFREVDWKNLNYNSYTYACGSLEGYKFKFDIPVYWGAGMAMNKDLALRIFQNDLIVEGRMKKKNYIMSGEDHEYSLRAFFNKAEFRYYSGVGLYHDFDMERLNDNYYAKVQIGFSYAAYILKLYYDIYNKNLFYSNAFFGFFYNIFFAIGYNFKYGFTLSGRLILFDSLGFSKFKNRFITVKNVI